MDPADAFPTGNSGNFHSYGEKKPSEPSEVSNQWLVTWVGSPHQISVLRDLSSMMHCSRRKVIHLQQDASHSRLNYVKLLFMNKIHHDDHHHHHHDQDQQQQQKPNSSSNNNKNGLVVNISPRPNYPMLSSCWTR